MSNKAGWLFGNSVTQRFDGCQLHGVVALLIDKSGQLRARYRGLKFDAAHAVVHTSTP